MCTSCKPKPYMCLFVLFGVVLLLAYQQLSDAQKRLVKNTLRQLPYLPFRYTV